MRYAPLAAGEMPTYRMHGYAALASFCKQYGNSQLAERAAPCTTPAGGPGAGCDCRLPRRCRRRRCGFGCGRARRGVLRATRLRRDGRHGVFGEVLPLVSRPSGYSVATAPSARSRDAMLQVPTCWRTRWDMAPACADACLCPPRYQRTIPSRGAARRAHTWTHSPAPPAGTRSAPVASVNS